VGGCPHSQRCALPCRIAYVSQDANTEPVRREAREPSHAAGSGPRADLRRVRGRSVRRSGGPAVARLPAGSPGVRAHRAATARRRAPDVRAGPARLLPGRAAAVRVGVPAGRGGCRRRRGAGRPRRRRGTRDRPRLGRADRLDAGRAAPGTGPHADRGVRAAPEGAPARPAQPAVAAGPVRLHGCVPLPGRRMAAAGRQRRDAARDDAADRLPRPSVRRGDARARPVDRRAELVPRTGSRPTTNWWR
jgi:hypothetical protein